MILKRKRSSSELCSSPSSGSSTSSSPPHQNIFNFSMMGASTTPSHASGRTMKRSRNNRPTEQLVHQRTLGLLYSAQQRPAHVQDMMDETSLEPSVQTPAPSPQESLHRFWNIASAPSTLSTPQEQTVFQATNCDDCGAKLNDDNDGMEIDSYGADDSACGACGKHVCFSCSVSNMGEQRRCLHCAGRKIWVGGIGWANAGASL